MRLVQLSFPFQAQSERDVPTRKRFLLPAFSGTMDGDFGVRTVTHALVRGRYPVNRAYSRSGSTFLLSYWLTKRAASPLSTLSPPSQPLPCLDKAEPTARE